jgi:hypothetical protein
MERNRKYLQHDFGFVLEFISGGNNLSDFFGVNLDHKLCPHVHEDVACEKISHLLAGFAIAGVTEELVRYLWVAMRQDRLHQSQPLLFSRRNIGCDLMDVRQCCRVGYARSVLDEIFDQTPKVLNALFMARRNGMEQLAADGGVRIRKEVNAGFRFDRAYSMFAESNQ